MAIVRYTLTLDPVVDAAVIRWLEAQPNKAAAIRGALVQQLTQPNPTQLEAKLDRLLQLVQLVPREPSAGLPQPPAAAWAEPEPAAAGLGRILERFASSAGPGV